MATRAKVKILFPVTNYNLISLLASNVTADMATNIAIFPVPSPTLVAINAQKTIVDGLITAWGPVGARGSHADLVALRAATYILRNMLVQEAAYVQNLVNPSDTYADQVNFIIRSGFAVKNAPTPQGVLGAPTNLHQMFAQTVPINDCKLKWKKPIGLNSKGNVKSYVIARNITGLAPTSADVIGTSTKTSFLDTTLVAGTAYTYFVAAQNDAGRGVWTAGLPVTGL